MSHFRRTRRRILKRWLRKSKALFSPFFFIFFLACLFFASMSATFPKIPYFSSSFSSHFSSLFLRTQFLVKFACTINDKLYSFFLLSKDAVFEAWEFRLSSLFLPLLVFLPMYNSTSLSSIFPSSCFSKF